MTTTSPPRPTTSGSSHSIISPHVALETLVSGAGNGVNLDLDEDVDVLDTLSGHFVDKGKRNEGRSQRGSSSRLGDSNNVNDHYEHNAYTRERDLFDPAPAHAIHADGQAPPPVSRMFVKAKFTFNATDPSALSFAADDIIEVYTRLESGWWDGMLGNTRGWFPSNFVEEVDPALILEGEGDEGNDFGGSGADNVGASTSAPAGLSNGHGDENGWGRNASVPREPQRERSAPQQHQWEGEGLDDLARQVMQGVEDMDHDDLNLDLNTLNIPDDADEFELAAVERRRRQNQALLDNQLREQQLGLGVGGIGANMDLGDLDAGQLELEQFGVPRRQREETNETIKPLTAGVAGLALNEGSVRIPENANIDMAQGDQSVTDDHSWIPTLTPDGQIYYHNPITGEDSWELPPTTPPVEEDEGWSQNHDDFLNPTSLTTGLSSTAYASTSANTLDTPESHESFRLPNKVQGDLPHPWVARMSDDGREWFYVNKLTGATRRDRPQSAEVFDKVERLSIGSNNMLPIRPARPKVRHSVEIRRKGVDEWTSRTRRALEEVLVPDAPHDMGWHMDVINDSLRDVFEAAVTGSAAEEELSRAADLGSRDGVEAALIREEVAVDMLKTSYTALLAVIRTLLAAYGYVGPLDGMVEMPRPKWTADMSLVGAMGSLSNHVHAAVASRRISDSGNSPWSDVMRSASKVKDLLSLFPAYITPDQPIQIQEAAIGKRATGTFGIEGVGEILARRWGFGQPPEHPGDVPFDPSAPPLRILDASFVAGMAKIRDEFHKIPFQEGTILDIIRAASRFKAFSLTVDIASAVDVDGDRSDRTREEDARIYAEILNDVQNSLLDLEEATASIDEMSIILLHVMDDDNRAYQTLERAVNIAFNAISALYQLSGQQTTLTERGNLKSQIGYRSSRFIPRRKTSGRPESLISSISRGSRKSTPVVRGLEEEFLEAHGNSLDLEDESRDRPSELNSANASQTSLLPQSQRKALGHGHGHGGQPGSGGGASGGQSHSHGDMSATSSTTSLAYQQTEGSDSGSVRGKRSSFMKYLKGRSSNDDDSRGTTRSNKGGPSRKLAKLLGEDFSSLPSIPPPSSTSRSNTMPETPWYLGEDYSTEDCTFDDRGMVKAATLPALVARLTPHGQTDTVFFQAFLLTFRSFTTGPELLELLIERYNIPPPEGMNPAELKDWKARKQTPIRLRVANTIRSWLENHYQEAEDRIVLDPIENFARDTLISNGSELLSKQLCSVVQRRRQGEGEVERRIISGSLLSPPAPLLPRTMPGRPIKLTDIAPIELARQLTILESGHFQKIGAAECMNKIWNQGKNPQDTPNISQIIRLANIISSWVAACVLASKDVKQRAGTLKYFIQTAIELRTMNNFSSMASIMAGVNSAPIMRLKRTHELLSAKTNLHKTDLEKTMDSTKNFSNYKEMLKNINPPCVPFFGFWLSALTFIEDGNRNIIKPGQSRSAIPNSASASSLSARVNGPANPSGPTGPAAQQAAAASASGEPVKSESTEPNPNARPLINFYKRHLAAEILRDVKQYQSQPYYLSKCKPVVDWMEKQFSIVEKTGQDMSTLYEVSLQLEPREREEERITRMLHDSGFI